MTCPRCQHENPDEARFCEECAALASRLACAQCGAANQPGREVLRLSAARLAGSPPSRPPAAIAPPRPTRRSTSPRRSSPPRAALEGERKQVTVLFADLKGSMELLADRDPEEARKLLDPVLERMMEAVHRYEGTVNQVMGDGIMALFGAPLAHEDHAVRACYAALGMQDARAALRRGAPARARA